MLPQPLDQSIDDTDRAGRDPSHRSRKGIEPLAHRAIEFTSLQKGLLDVGGGASHGLSAKNARYPR